jgi:hypothetical protein
MICDPGLSHLVGGPLERVPGAGFLRRKRRVDEPNHVGFAWRRNDNGSWSPVHRRHEEGAAYHKTDENAQAGAQHDRKIGLQTSHLAMV